jgi:hypothetical protein
VGLLLLIDKTFVDGIDGKISAIGTANYEGSQACLRSYSIGGKGKRKLLRQGVKIF